MAFMAIIMGLGLLFYMLLRFRNSFKGFSRGLYRVPSIRLVKGAASSVDYSSCRSLFSGCRISFKLLK